MIIQLKVFEQTLSIVDTKSVPRKGSKDYLVLQFMFSSDWKDLNKLCYLQKGEVSQPVDVVNNLVKVPEWFTQQDHFYITLFGKNDNQEVPTNVVPLRLDKSNTLWEKDAPEPQPSWIVKLIDLNNHPPVPGNNGYWMLWDTDKSTYVESDLPLPPVSVGPKGDKGDTGEQGPAGPAGADGKDGSGMDITGASVGQIAKITAVDSSGKPTAWEAVDMPSGGGETWEKIAEIVIPEGADESTALTISQDFDGNPFSLVKARLCAKFPKYTGETSIPRFSFAMLNGKTTGSTSPLAYTSVWPEVSKSNTTGTVYEIDVSGTQQIEHVIKSLNSGWSPDTPNNYIIYGTSNNKEFTIIADTLWAKPITSIGGAGMLIYPGCRFVLYGVRT